MTLQDEIQKEIQKMGLKKLDFDNLLSNEEIKQMFLQHKANEINGKLTHFASKEELDEYYKCKKFIEQELKENEDIQQEYRNFVRKFDMQFEDLVFKFNTGDLTVSKLIYNFLENCGYKPNIEFLRLAADYDYDEYAARDYAQEILKDENNADRIKIAETYLEKAYKLGLPTAVNTMKYCNLPIYNNYIHIFKRLNFDNNYIYPKNTLAEIFEDKCKNIKTKDDVLQAITLFGNYILTDFDKWIIDARRFGGTGEISGKWDKKDKKYIEMLKDTLVNNYNLFRGDFDELFIQAQIENLDVNNEYGRKNFTKSVFDKCCNKVEKGGLPTLQDFLPPQKNKPAEFGE